MVKKVVIVGAPRSGTNMLRDALTRLPGVGTWPCDEINYIWRHGNVRYPSDEFTPTMARAPVQRYIQRAFERQAKQQRLHTVVEKTCANSLRVGFVDRVVPDAQYVLIRRDGLDAVGSALKRWTASLEFRYLARKARFVPPVDLPYYATRYLWNRVYRVVSRQKRLAFWGPRLDGMEALLARHTLEEVCALQWQRCVESSAAAFASMGGGRVVEVVYGDLVANPEPVFRGVVDALGLDSAGVTGAIRDISDRSVGKGRRELGEAGIQSLMPLIGSTLEKYGYG